MKANEPLILAMVGDQNVNLGPEDKARWIMHMGPEYVQAVRVLNTVPAAVKQKMEYLLKESSEIWTVIIALMGLCNIAVVIFALYILVFTINTVVPQLQVSLTWWVFILIVMRLAIQACEIDFGVRGAPERLQGIVFGALRSKELISLVVICVALLVVHESVSKLQISAKQA